MKKTVIALALVCASALMAGEVKIDWAKAKVGDVNLPGWVMDKYGDESQLGTFSVVNGSKEGTLAVEMKGKNRTTNWYRTRPVKAKVGDIVKITAKAKGTGTIRFGYYCYDYSFVGKVLNNITDLPVSAEAKELTAEMEIKQPLESGRTVTSVRPFLSIGANSSAVLEDVKIEIIEK